MKASVTIGLFAIISILLSVSLSVSQSAGPKCRVLYMRKARTRKGPCRIAQYSATVYAKAERIRVNLREQEISCGAVKLGAWKGIRREGLRLCSASSAGGRFYLRRSFTVLDHWGRLLSVRQKQASYTGGAHPTRYVTQRTYDLKTGKPLSLRDIYPRRHTRYMDLAKKRFSQSPNHDDYRFDPRAFRLTVKRRYARIEFAMPHLLGALRGTTLDLSLRASKPLAFKR
jgi:hypothetical protein